MKAQKRQLAGIAVVLAISLPLFGCQESGGPLPSATDSSASAPGSAGTAGGSELFSGLRDQQSVQKLIYHVGPADITTKKSPEEMLANPQTMEFQVTEPVWIVGFKPQVLDANGNPLPGRLLYKAILLNKHEPNPLCATGSEGNPFAIATATLTKVELPEGYGYPLMPTDPLEAKVIFQNQTDQDYLGVTFSFELEAIPMDKAKGYGDVKAMLLDADPCQFKPIALEPGQFVQKSKTFSIPEGGNLLVANGALSNYGVSVSLTHQGKSEATVVPFWRAEAQMDESHSIVDLTPNPFIEPEGKQIADGDKITLGVAFDNFSNDWNFAATGAAMVYLAPNSAE